MQDPWELKSDDQRVEDSLPTFVIFCEDEVSEYLYFKFFETNKIKINIIGNQKSMMDNVINAITYCKENNLLASNDEQDKLSTDFLQVWCVYDRDFEDDVNKNRKGNTEFDESINTASNKGFKIAWSIDAFELWVLLHFEDIDNEQDYTKRTVYYDKLTDIFKTLPDPNVDLQKALVHASFGYKKDLKQKNNFRDIVRPLMVVNTHLAIERAKVLESQHADKAYHHQKAPCTLVYKLVQELLSIGQKELE